MLLLCCFSAGFLSGQDSSAHRVIYVGMILGSGGLGDRSFNDSAYEGLRDAQNRFGIRFEVVDFVSEEANLQALRDFAEQSFDLIIGIGFENRKAIETVARENPDIHFAVIDVEAQGENIASIIYREHEGDFLMGVLAAMLTRTGRVGFIGGMDIPVIRRIESGFRQGVAHQNTQVEVVSEMAGTFSDAELGRELALAQYASGVDIIYNGAGRTGLGIIQAAKETGRLTIGTSGDQRYLAPDNVVGNRPKRVDRAVLRLIGPFNEKIASRTIVRHLEQIKSKIIAGEIKVSEAE